MSAESFSAIALALVGSFGWPHLALVFGLVFMITFRKSLDALLSRITSIDRTGIKALPPAAAQPEGDPITNKSAQQLMMEIGNSAVIQMIETDIRTDLSARGMDTSQRTTVDALIKVLAATRLTLGFEQIHNGIFGSQLFLLKKLNEVREQGLSSDWVRAHYDGVKVSFGDTFKEWTFDQYLTFLFRWNLIELRDDVAFHITEFGCEFLIWMARSGRSETKAF